LAFNFLKIISDEGTEVFAPHAVLAYIKKGCDLKIGDLKPGDDINLKLLVS
jgi:hypothetical protein